MFQQHYSDRNIGGTTAKKLWEKGKTSNEDPTDSQGVVVNINCGCCEHIETGEKSILKHTRAYRNLLMKQCPIKCSQIRW